MKTTKGYKVMGLQPSFDTKTYAFALQSGRVRVVEGNPYHDKYVRWDMQGKAHEHDFGNLILRKGGKG